MELPHSQPTPATAPTHDPSRTVGDRHSRQLGPWQGERAVEVADERGARIPMTPTVRDADGADAAQAAATRAAAERTAPKAGN